MKKENANNANGKIRYVFFSDKLILKLSIFESFSDSDKTTK